MRKSGRMILVGLCVFIVFYLISSGCAWITLTAKDRLLDKIVLKSNNPVQSIYVVLLPPSGKQNKAWERVATELREKLRSKGYTLLSSSESADLIVKLKVHCFTKKEGTQYFFLGLIPTPGIGGGPYNVEGLKVDAEYTTDQGKWNKTYLAYRKYEHYAKVANAIISDLNQLIATKRVAD